MNDFWLRGLLTAFVSLCVGLSVNLVRANLGVSLLDAMCVGLGCWFCVDGLRMVVARWRWRGMGQGSSRGAAPDGTYYHWPGWRWMAFCMVLGTAVGGLFSQWLAQWLALGLGLVPDRPTWQAMPGHGGMAFGISLLGTLSIALAISYVFYTRERVTLSLNEAEAARRLAAESHLRLLQAQLEPHMLFNTLANLRVLIAMDPPRSLVMLDRLIGFLRSTLSASRCSVHPLSDEFDRLRDYLDLMQVRMGPRLRTHLGLPQALRDCPVPPWLLQPLVENALQHGLEPKVEGGELWVEAWQEGEGAAGALCIRVRDSGLGMDHVSVSAAGQRPGAGFGLQQVRDRLAVNWGGTASLTLHAMPQGGTQAILVLPMDHLKRAG